MPFVQCSSLLVNALIVNLQGRVFRNFLSFNDFHALMDHLFLLTLLFVLRLDHLIALYCFDQPNISLWNRLSLNWLLWGDFRTVTMDSIALLDNILLKLTMFLHTLVVGGPVNSGPESLASFFVKVRSVTASVEFQVSVLRFFLIDVLTDRLSSVFCAISGFEEAAQLLILGQGYHCDLTMILEAKTLLRCQ